MKKESAESWGRGKSRQCQWLMAVKWMRPLECRHEHIRTHPTTASWMLSFTFGTVSTIRQRASRVRLWKDFRTKKESKTQLPKVECWCQGLVPALTSLQADSTLVQTMLPSTNCR